MLIPSGSVRHKQGQSNLCGAAAAMMILVDGFQKDPAAIDQVKIFNAAPKSSANWYMDPDALAAVLSSQARAGFVVNKPGDKSVGNQQIVAALHEYGIPPAVTIYEADHWVVVDAVEIEGDISKDFVLQNIYFHEPLCTQFCPLSHKIGDDCLGPHEVVHFEGWNNMFDGAAWGANSGLFASVTRPINVKIGKPMPPEKVAFNALSARHGVDSLINARFMKDGEDAAFLRSSALIGPRYVRRLDRPDLDYLLYAFRADGGIVCQILVEAGSGGGLWGMRWEHEGLEGFSVFDSWDSDSGRLLAQLGGNIDYRGSYLVWRPCAESGSPYLPFFKVQQGLDSRYLRIDGGVLTSRLTSHMKGA